ncbi:type II secretion system F family protein [Arthrobacter sp. ISL-48]|uniref:type II secretion system F family protein n=1 Tax=Arthrobacter sp. ISL-48 TaxID=2819110 RepID=UPI001BE5C91B|nr:type II secretion system F family protein [Arthrobacter sp. ISL-48]MBT2532336.1 type II secretion system F family protein [Arthrobacter sp. ISL-48]
MTDAFLPGLVLMVALIAASCLVHADHGRVRKRLRHLQMGQESGRFGDRLNKAGSLDHADSRDTRPKAVQGGSLHGLRDTAMMLELVAAMLDAGSGIGRSLELLAASASSDYARSLRPVVSALAIGADWETAWRSSEVRLPEILELRDALGFAAMTGAPSSAILYAQAARLRRERFRAAEKRAASLGVKLVIPLGLCSLPAFICLGVVPVLLALVPSGS